MKKYNKDQNFHFEVAIQAIIKDKNYDDAMKRIIEDVNKINNGDVIIENIKGSNPISRI